MRTKPNFTVALSTFHSLRSWRGVRSNALLVGLAGVASPQVDWRFRRSAQAQVEQLLASVLADAGIRVELYPTSKVNDLQASIEPEQRQAEAQAWLASKRQGYVLQGAVQEWQYKYGLDGEPAVGVTLQLSDLNGQVLWRGSIAKSGWGRESLSQLGLTSLRKLTANLNWD